MVHFEWDPSLETGNTAIDDQHRGLFRLANELQEAVESDADDSGAVADAIYGLADYVVQHFDDEEALMADAGYPALPTHRSLHEHLSAETLRFMTRYFAGEHLAAGRIAPFLAEWLRQHILGEDARFVTWAKNR